MPGTINVHKQLGKASSYREISGKFGVVNTTGTDENLFRLESVLGQGALVLPLELVPVPAHSAQINVWAPTEGYVQTGARARAPVTGTKSEQGFSSEYFLMLPMYYQYL